MSHLERLAQVQISPGNDDNFGIGFRHQYDTGSCPHSQKHPHSLLAITVLLQSQFEE